MLARRYTLYLVNIVSVLDTSIQSLPCIWLTLYPFWKLPSNLYSYYCNLFSSTSYEQLPIWGVNGYNKIIRVLNLQKNNLLVLLIYGHCG